MPSRSVSKSEEVLNLLASWTAALGHAEVAGRPHAGTAGTPDIA
jgi:hypothetical protein